MTNKLVLQQLKGVLRGLNDHDIEKLLSNYETVSNVKIDKTCRMVSYKCYEASMSYKSWNTNGYGRTEAEALNNCAKNFLELVMEDETSLANLIKAVKKGSESSLQANQAKETADKMNSTLALNASYAQPHNNTSFDNKNELDILSKNIGNISMIGNLKPTGEAAVNASQLEIDDILLKMMLDDGGNPGGVNNFRKSLPPQHPNGLDLGSGGQGLAATKNYSSGSYKPERNSVGGSTTATAQNDDVLSHKKSVQENTNLGYGGSHVHSSDKTEERYGSRNGRATHQPNYYSSKTLNFSKTLDQKPLYQRQNSHDAYGESSQKEKETTKDVRSSIEKCSCNCYEQLQRANLRVESLEKKLKLLTEENKILKYLAESKDKELKSELSVGNSVAAPTKSVYEKMNGNYDAINNENYDDINEFSEREPINPNDKSRSFSMDAYGRKKTIPESQFNYKNPLTSYNKENATNESMDKKDPKKIVPRLKLEMIPNYHAKFSQAQNQAQNPLGVQNTNAVGASKGYVQQATQNPTSNLYSSDTFEVGIVSNGKEVLDEAAKLMLVQDWVVTSKGKISDKMSQDSKGEKKDAKVKLIDNAHFAEFSLGLYIHN